MVLFNLPALRILDLANNSLTDFPEESDAIINSISNSGVTNVTLDGNRWWCPIPDYILDTTLRFKSDLTSSSCVRTKSLTVKYTPTLIVEPPVPTSNVFDGNRTLDRLYIRTALNISNQEILANITDRLNQILRASAPASGGTAAPSPLATALFDLGNLTLNDRMWLEIDFSQYLSQTTNEQRIDLGLRIRFSHSSVTSLRITGFQWLYAGDTFPTEPPLPTQTPQESIAQNAESRGLLIAGACIFVLIFVIIAIALVIRRKPYADIDPAVAKAAPQPPVPELILPPSSMEASQRGGQDMMYPMAQPQYPPRSYPQQPQPQSRPDVPFSPAEGGTEESAAQEERSKKEKKQKKEKKHKHKKRDDDGEDGGSSTAATESTRHTGNSGSFHSRNQGSTTATAVPASRPQPQQIEVEDED